MEISSPSLCAKGATLNRCVTATSVGTSTFPSPIASFVDRRTRLSSRNSYRKRTLTCQRQAPQPLKSLLVGLLSWGKGSTTVYSIKKQRLLPKTSSSPSRDNCFRCGRLGHNPQNCKCKEMDRLQCGKRGHIARACPAKNNSKPSWSKHQRQPAQHRL